MPEYRLFHSLPSSPTHLMPLSRVRVSVPFRVKKEHYYFVARVTAEGIETVYRNTQHATRTWTTLDNVVMESDYKVRSTAIGDIVVDEQGLGHYCDGESWTGLGQVVIEESYTRAELVERWGAV